MLTSPLLSTSMLVVSIGSPALWIAVITVGAALVIGWVKPGAARVRWRALLQALFCSPLMTALALPILLTLC